MHNLLSKITSIGSLDLNLKLAQIFGVPLIIEKNSMFSKYFIQIYCILFFILFNLCYWCFEILDLIKNGDTFDTIAQNACLTVTHLGGNIKFINIMFRMQKVQKIIAEMKQLQKTVVINREHQKIFRSSEFENKLIVIAYTMIVLSTALLGNAILFNDPTLGGRIFPYRALLPEILPVSLRIIYWSIGISVLAFQILAIDCLNVNLINQIRLNLKLLNVSLSELASTDIEKRNSCEILTDCVKHHQLILQSRNDIEIIFKYPILVQFCVSLFIFVMTGFQAIVQSGSEEIIIIYFYCGCITCQLFSYCWFANQVMEEIKFLVIGGYNTSWFDFDNRYGKILLLFMMNAQRPLTFTVGGFFDLSLKAFTGILSRSYSFIAVLRQVYAN